MFNTLARSTHTFLHRANTAHILQPVFDYRRFYALQSFVKADAKPIKQSKKIVDTDPDEIETDKYLKKVSRKDKRTMRSIKQDLSKMFKPKPLKKTKKFEASTNDTNNKIQLKFYNDKINQFFQQGNREEGKTLLEVMITNGVQPDSNTLSSLIEGYGKLKMFADAEKIYNDSRKYGVEIDTHITASMLQANIDNKSPDQVVDFYYKLPDRLKFPHSTALMVQFYFNRDDIQSVEDLMKSVQQKFEDSADPHLLSALMSGYIQKKQYNKARDVLNQATPKHLTEEALANLRILLQHLMDTNDMLAAQAVFDKLKIKDKTYYDPIVRKYLALKNWDMADKMLTEMYARNVSPSLNLVRLATKAFGDTATPEEKEIEKEIEEEFKKQGLDISVFFK
jgi:pentatricopeptide repeat protein